MKWVVFDFKTAKEPWFEEVEKLYLKKLTPMVSFEVFHFKTLKGDRDQAEIKKKFECKAILEKLTKDDFVILMDEKGKHLDSIEFAKMIQAAQESGKKRGVFVIGGAYGVSDEIRTQSQRIISLGHLTMNHLVAETVLLEQFYRSQTILNRIPYHNI